MYCNKRVVWKFSRADLLVSGAVHYMSTMSLVVCMLSHSYERRLVVVGIVSFDRCKSSSYYYGIKTYFLIFLRLCGISVFYH